VGEELTPHACGGILLIFAGLSDIALELPVQIKQLSF